MDMVLVNICRADGCAHVPPLHSRHMQEEMQPDDCHIARDSMVYG